MATTTDPLATIRGRRSPWEAAALVAVAVVMLAAQWLLARNAGAWTHTSVRTLSDVAPLVALLAIPGLLAVLAAPAWLRLQPTALGIGSMLVLGLLMRLVWYGAPAPLEDDFYRYMWDGAVLAAGHNPYALSPGEAAAGNDLSPALAPLARQAADVLARVNFPEMTSIYPGLAQVAFAVAHVLAPFKLEGLRFVFLLADTATLWVLLVIAKDLGRTPLIAGLYWLNPLVVWSSHGTVHSDALLPPLLLGACLMVWRGRDLIAAALLAGAVGVKIWPVLLAPLLGRHVWGRRRTVVAPALVFGLLSGLLMLPLGLSALEGMRSGLVAYSGDWWNNNAAFAWVSYGVFHLFSESQLALRLLRFATAIAVGLLALHLARRPLQSLRELLTAAMTIAAVLFYVSPAEFPWYALWFLGLAAAIECRPLLLASATLAIYYCVFPLSAQGQLFAHLYYVAALHALPVWAWLAWDWYRQRRSGTHTPAGVNPRPLSPSAS